MFKKIRCVVLTGFALFLSHVALAADPEIDQFTKKYGISSSQLDQIQKSFLNSDLGLKKLTGFRDQLAVYAKKKIKTEDMVRFAGAFARTVDLAAVKNLTEIGGGFGLTQKDYDHALDEALDKTDGENPKEFVKKIAETLVVLSKTSKISQEKALLLARAVQIRMDLLMMKNHLNDEDYMRNLLGEKALGEIPLERNGKSGGVI